MRNVFLVGLVCLGLASCSTTSLDIGPGSELGTGAFRSTKNVAASHGVGFRALNSVVGTSLSTDIETGIDDDFSKTLTQCQPVLSGYESQATTLKWVSFGIAMLGTVAGSVAVPALTAASAANKVSIAALGGLAGAANSAQNVLNSEGLNSVEQLTIRDNIRQQFSAALADYFQARAGDNSNAQVAALEKAQAACVDYAIAVGTPLVTDSGK